MNEERNVLIASQTAGMFLSEDEAIRKSFVERGWMADKTGKMSFNGMVAVIEEEKEPEAEIPEEKPEPVAAMGVDYAPVNASEPQVIEENPLREAMLPDEPVEEAEPEVEAPVVPDTKPEVPNLRGKRRASQSRKPRK